MAPSILFTATVAAMPTPTLLDTAAPAVTIILLSSCSEFAVTDKAFPAEILDPLINASVVPLISFTPTDKPAPT